MNATRVLSSKSCRYPVHDRRFSVPKVPCAVVEDATERPIDIDRYGITPNDEQYTGWKQLPTAAGEPPMTTHGAEHRIRKVADMTDNTALSVVLRRARFVAHPDRNNGDTTQWDRVEAAAKVLRAAGRLS